MKFYVEKINNVDCIILEPFRHKSRYIKYKSLDHLNALSKRAGNKDTNIVVQSFQNKIARYDSDISLNKEFNIKDHNTYALKLGNYPFPSTYLEKMNIRSNEKICEIPIHNELIQYIDKFLKNKSFYKDEGLFYKTGLLLYGPPGNSKTTFLRHLVANYLPKEALVIWCQLLPTLQMIKNLKEYTGPKVFIFEELTSILSRSNIGSFLDFMDGENSIDNAIFIATTNYPEDLPGNIVERPGRFDKIMKFDNPTNDVKQYLFKNMFKLDITTNELAATKDFSIAQLKEIYLQVKVHNRSILGAIQYINDHKKFVKNNFAVSRKLGI